MKRGVRRTIEAVIGIGVIAAAVIWLSGGFGTRVPPGEVDRAVATAPSGNRVVTVALETAPAFEWASGSTASVRQTSIASRLLARIEKVNVTSGAMVAEGDTLIVLDARDLDARVQQARAALRAMRARLDLARTEMTRSEKLLQQGATTRKRFDEAVSGLRVAEAESRRLKQSLDEAGTALSHTVIRAPYAGRVVDRLAEPGDTAAPGQALLRLYDPSAIRVEAPIRESLAIALKTDQVLRVEIPAIARTVDGVIDEIVPFADPGARTLLVKVRLPRLPNLIAGLFARVAVPAGRHSRLLLPAAAIERIGQLEFANVVGANEAPSRRLVTTAKSETPDMVEVLSGLGAGERVYLAESE